MNADANLTFTLRFLRKERFEVEDFMDELIEEYGGIVISVCSGIVTITLSVTLLFSFGTFLKAFIMSLIGV